MRRYNILVHAEEILWVILRLELGKARIVCTIGPVRRILGFIAQPAMVYIHAAAELGVSPSDEITEFYQSLKDQHGRHPRTSHVHPSHVHPSIVPPYLPRLPAFLEADTGREPEEALFVAREQELASLDQFLQLALAGQGRMAFVTGEAGSGKTALLHAFALSRQLGNVWGQAFAQYSLPPVYWDQGNPDQALAIIQESLRLGELAGFVSPAVECRIYWAIVYAGLGMCGRGLELVEQATQSATAKVAVFKGYAFTVWAQLLLRQNQLAEAQTRLEQAQQDVFTQAHPAVSVWYEVETTEAELALRQGDCRRALALTSQAIPLLRQGGLRPKLVRALYVQGQAWLVQEQTDAARACWREARDEAEAIGSRWMLWQILAALAPLETDAVQAEAMRQRAREMLKTIGQHISDPELRASFYDLPAVRNLVAADDC